MLRQSQTVFTGGEDGLVRAWKPADGEDAQSSSAKSSRPREKGKEKGKTKERFKPY